MERRKFLIGAGSLAAGGAAAMGSGAFTTASADRTAKVNVAADSSSYVGIKAVESSPYASGTGSGQLELDFSEDNAQGVFGGGKGLNPDSEYNFDDLFRVLNQGPGGDVRVVITKSGFNLENLEITTNPDDTSPSKSLLAEDYEDPVNVPKLVEPDDLTANMTIETKDSTDSDAGGTLTIHAARGNNYQNSNFASLLGSGEAE